MVITKIGDLSRRIALLGAVLCCLTACTERLDVQETFVGSCWEKVDTLYYAVSSPGTVSLTPTIFFTNDYSYRNLYLKVLVKEENILLADTMLQQVFMDEMGVWSVPYQGGTYRVAYEVQLTLPPTTTRIGLVQYMRDDALCGIESAGFRIE
ncbi:MAG: hypothetical protein AAF824_09695 [Bacteroidota bacterium]